MPSGALPGLRRGHVKIMLGEIGGTLTPDEDELARMVLAMHRSGRDVAIHAVEERAVAASIAAIEAALETHPGAHRHRIEHAALLPAGGARRMATLGITVVTQPSFLYEQGDRYLRDVPAEKHERLYPIGDLMYAGVRMAASTDAPVAAVDALEGLRASVGRRTTGGAIIGAGQRVSFEDALRMWTAGAACACGIEARRGRIAPGMAADIVLLAGPPHAPEVDVVWRDGERTP